MICGKDLDEVFAYQTPKIVILKDRKLGFIAISLKVLIFVYIFLWTILFQGTHLSVADVDGVNRLSVRNPTRHMCDSFRVGCRANYTPFTELPYCLESNKTLKGAGKKLTCQAWDSVEVVQPAESGILLPTRVRKFEQVRGCEPSADNGWICDGAPYENLAEDGTEQTEEGEAVPLYHAYVADIEHFTLLIDHSFRRYGGMQADDMEMPGHYYECPSRDAHVTECDLRQIPCVHEDCPAGTVKTSKEEHLLLALRGGRAHTVAFDNRGVAAFTKVRAAHEETPAMLASKLMSEPSGYAGVAVKKGDVFTVGSLLRLAKVDLDDSGKYPSSYRGRGMVLVVHIQYDNRPSGGFLGLQITPWRTPEPFYTYRITTREAYDYRLMKSYNDPANPRRSVRVYNGIRVVVEQSGTIALWDTAQFLVTMTTAMGLMAAANFVTDFLLMYILSKSEEYKKRKFHTSKDFCPEDEGAQPSRPTTKKEAGDLFIDAMESQDGEAVADAFPDLLALCGKKGT